MNIPEEYLQPTYFINSDSKIIINQARKIVQNEKENKEKAIKLFYWVRDEIRYDPYTFSALKRDYKATKILERGKGWCVQKAILLTALGRAAGIPSRLHFADIRNHQITPKLKKEMGTDLFIFHGYNEFFLNNKWVKATCAFNKELGEKFNHKTVEFDGETDAILPEFTLDGKKHIEYIKDRGVTADLPLKKIFEVFTNIYLVPGKGSLNIFSKAPNKSNY